MAGLVEFSNSQRILWDWLQRRRKNTLEDLRLALLFNIGQLAELSRKENRVASEEIPVLGRVGILYIAICSAMNEFEPLVWVSGSEDDPVLKAAAKSYLLARVLEFSREDFPNVRFFRVVRYLSAVCSLDSGTVVEIFIKAIEEVVREKGIPEGL